MIISPKFFVLSGLVVLSVGCGGPVEDPDVSKQLLGLSCPVGAPPTDWQYPAGPYGIDVDARFEDITLRSCDGEDVRFGDILASSELVLFNVGAGWCEPCIEESKVLEAQVVEPFCADQVRVVQVLFQDDQGRPATTQFCNEWKARFGLTAWVLIDPLFETSRYFEAAQTPLNFLIDREGFIRFKSTGSVVHDLDRRIQTTLDSLP